MPDATPSSPSCSAREATDGLFHPCCGGCDVLGCYLDRGLGDEDMRSLLREALLDD